MSKRIYLDYNATAPVMASVWAALSETSVLDVNPSSQHTSGKTAHKEIKQVESFLYNTFGLSVESHNLLFHSGATEAFNTLFNLSGGINAFIYFTTDHPAIKFIAKSLESNGVEVHCLNVGPDGMFDISAAQVKLKDYADKFDEVWINTTYMNNETGVVWPLAEISKLKVANNIKLHVDAVQMIGKVSENLLLSDHIDAYTFSGHKFGALKGVGFSFYKKAISIAPLILGGGQQNFLRSGTLNYHGILSLKYALNGRDFGQEFLETKKLKDKILQLISNYPKLSVIPSQSSNTICLLHETKRADEMLILFDMNGLDVSSGSACSSGSVEASHVLEAMGLTNKAKNNIRLSLSYSHISLEKDLLTRLQNIFSKL